ncbi:protein mono-ADP-ribosyltransferase PARP14-like isoform X2 [Dreissena polymorpha]|uniref:protein mono-ADP-ribosyltransferase PARP14-like isoform X2 n=1 Tax=Dreissena polymorpha TaxID=45954 RepID=UPI0022641741|nr:protein mono-ADP-ribosyltransferase PARP14-like isoform X2 [Dreissena polymorpha]
MDLLLSKCVILKNLSVTASEEDVRKCLKLQNLSDAFHDIERYAVNDTDVRWIILFNTAEDAMKCLHTKEWAYQNEEIRALIKPEICIENLIPVRWLEQMQESVTGENANAELEYVPTQSFALSVLMTSDSDKYSDVDIVESGSESMISKKVTVTGFQVGTANEEMKSFFESISSSGGGNIVAFDLNQYQNVVTIEFEHHNDVNEVLQKANKEGGILYNRMMLKASPFIESVIDTSKVLVSGISEQTSDELAALFMEAKWHIKPKKIVRGILPGTALVEFSSHPDITKLKSICKDYACADALWNVSVVEMSSKVLVTGCSSTTTVELLDLYFENNKRSGGGDVLYVEPHHDCSNEFVITFQSKSDAESVVKEDRAHVLDNCKLTVSVYYPCLDRDLSEQITIPEPVLIDDLDQYRAKFLFESDQNKAKIEASLKDVFGRPVWIVDNNSSKILKIECIVDPKDSVSRRFIIDWKERVRKCISWINDEIKVDDSNVVASELFEQMKIKLQRMTIRRPEDLAIVLDRKSSGIVIVGEAKVVDQLSWDIAKLITELEDELEKNNSNTEACEIIEIEPGRFQFIYTHKKNELRRFEEQYQRLDVVCTCIDEPIKKGFMFQGPQSAVKSMITKMQTFIDNIVCKYIVVTSPGFHEFILRKSGKRALKEIEDKRQCVLRYGLNNAENETPHICYDLANGHRYSIGSCKVMVILKDITGIKADAIINPCFGDLSNPLGLGALLVEKGGLRIQQELDAHNEKNKVMIGGVYVTQAGNLPYKAIIHVVVPTWSDKSSNEKRLLGSTIFNAIEHADKMGFKHIVTPPIGTGIPGFPPEMVADKMLDTLANYFQSGQKRVTENIIICDIKEESIDAFLSTLESGDEVRLREQRQEEQPRSGSFESKVYLVKGTLASTKADVLVNSSNQDLDLRLGTISKQLVAAAGEELIKECSRRYPNGISLGKVAVTSAGQLKTSQRIFHGLLPPWDSGKGHSDTAFEEVEKSKKTKIEKRRIEPSKYIPDVGEENDVAEVKKQDTRQTVTTIYIYAYSEHTAQQAAGDVLDLYDSQIVGIPKSYMKIISVKHLTDLKQRADKLGVTLVDKPDGIVIQGLKCNIQEMKDIVDRCRESINRTIQTHADRKLIPLPPSWKMTMGDTTKVVQLNPSDQEYTILAKRFCSETLVPIQNIVSIERIQNPTLYMQNYGKKKEMETANIGSHNPIERRLWLGTRSADVTQNIYQKGFDRKLKSGTTLGSGVMFAVNARTALGYCQADATGSRRMYYVDVLTGDSCAGSGLFTKPPSRNDPKNPMRCFDSTTLYYFPRCPSLPFVFDNVSLTF